MTLSELRELCLSFPGVTEDIKWEDHLCFNIGGKMFLITSPDQHPVTASFKVREEDFEKISGMNGFSPAAYLARYKWVYINDIELVSNEKWEDFARTSYDLVKSKLPKKLQKELGE